jgi:hypothetical protein
MVLIGQIICEPATPGKRRVYRTWIPLWHWLRETAMVNAFIIWRTLTNSSKQQDAHVQFKKKLALSVLKRSRDRVPRAPKTPASSQADKENESPYKSSCERVHVILSKRQGYCASCTESKRLSYGGNRKPLSELSLNTVRGNRDKKTTT